MGIETITSSILHSRVLAINTTQCLDEGQSTTTRSMARRLKILTQLIPITTISQMLQCNFNRITYFSFVFLTSLLGNYGVQTIHDGNLKIEIRNH